MSEENVEVVRAAVSMPGTEVTWDAAAEGCGSGGRSGLVRALGPQARHLSGSEQVEGVLAGVR